MNASLAPSSPLPLWRSLLVVALAGLTVCACLLTTPQIGKSEAAIRMNLPLFVGSYQGTDQPVSDSERAILPKDTEFAKKSYTDASGKSINCQVVLAGAEKRSIHRPEVCLPAQGWTIKSGGVVPVKLSDGRTLDVMKLLIARPIVLPNGERRELTSIFCYWFVGKGTTTPYHFVRIFKTSLDLLLHNVNHRWAYVIVSSPVLAGLSAGGESEEQTSQSIQSFISELAPQIVALRNNRGSLQRDNMWRCGVLFRFSDGFFQIVRGMRFQKEGSARSRKASGGAGKFKSW